MARARRVPLPGLSKGSRSRLVLLESHDRGVRFPVSRRDQVMKALVWAGSLLLVGAFAGIAVHTLGAALAAVPFVKPKRRSCEACDAGDLSVALSTVRWVEADMTSVEVTLCKRHFAAARQLKAYLRRRDREAWVQ